MILNLTQHMATPEQLDAGVVEPSGEAKAVITALLTFDILPTQEDIEERAMALAGLAYDEIGRLAAERGFPITADEGACVMIGGAPFLMPRLEMAIRRHEPLEPVYAFSERVSTEQIQPDGSVRKVNTFRHLGFVSLDV